VWVLAVGELALLDEGQQEALREGLAIGEPGRNRGLVDRRGGERFRGENAARRQRDLAALGELLEDDVVLHRRGDRHDVHEVLGRRAKHRGASDVDHLDRVLLTRVLPPGDLVEGIEVDADEVDRLDVMLGQRLHVVLLVAPRQDARVHAGVKGLHPAAEQLGRLRQLVDPPHRKTLLLEAGRRAAARK
jgi:hypothetical protein